MADLSQLFQVAPDVASYFTGQNQANSFQQGQLQNQELSQRIQLEMEKEKREAELQPYNVRKADLANQTSEAELPGHVAESKKKGLDAQLEEQTLPSKVASTNSSNDATVGKNNLENLQRGQQAMVDISNAVSSVPAPFRRQMAEQIMTSNGMNPKSPHLSALLSVDPEQMPNVAQQLAARLGSQALAMNPSAQAAIQGHEIGANATRYTADQHRASIENAATTRANALIEIRKAATTAQGIVQQALNGKFTMDKAVSTLTLLSGFATSDEEKAQYDEASKTLQGIMNNKAAAAGGARTGLIPDGKGGFTLGTNPVQPVVPKATPRTQRQGGADPEEQLSILREELAKSTQMLANPKEHMSPAMLKTDPDGTAFTARAARDVQGLQAEISKLTGGKSGPKQGTAENPIVLK